MKSKLLAGVCFISTFSLVSLAEADKTPKPQVPPITRYTAAETAKYEREKTAWTVEETDAKLSTELLQQAIKTSHLPENHQFRKRFGELALTFVGVMEGKNKIVKVYGSLNWKHFGAPGPGVLTLDNGGGELFAEIDLTNKVVQKLKPNGAN